MKFRYSFIAFFLVFLFLGCASHNMNSKKIPDSVIDSRIKELRQRLGSNGVPGKWFDDQIDSFSFRLHSNMDQYFQKSIKNMTLHGILPFWVLTPRSKKASHSSKIIWML
jgi:hypothetical protein